MTSRTAFASLLFIAGCQSVPTSLPPAGAQLRGHLSAFELRNLHRIQRIHEPGLGLVRRFRESGLLADSAEWWVADCSARTLARALTWNLVTDAGRLGIAFEPAGTEGYADLERDAERFEAFGVRFLAASVADIIRSKEATGRARDREDVAVLKAMERRGMVDGS